MAVLKIETGEDNEILRTRSKEVVKPDKKLGKLLDDMRETMHATNGLGLAAAQVGHNIRVCVCHFNQGTDNALIVDVINPESVPNSDETEVGEEGCLSLPGKFGNVSRYRSVMLKFSDRKGNKQALKLEGLNAVIIQHEVDHLDGKLFVDRMDKQVVTGVGREL